jgi:hypothetical protein
LIGFGAQKKRGRGNEGGRGNFDFDCRPAKQKVAIELQKIQKYYTNIA